ncbi:MAG: glycosyltransferase family 2 protein [Spirochaetaceae bacterium]|nr:glycosyltransferase family 2 protein [Spirochaetaceae bacterium]
MIIPAYNESKNIKLVVENIINNYPQYDYVIVNDGSQDDTAAICYKNNYNIIDLPVNLGIGGAVQCGYIYAYQNDYDISVQIDGDGQHDPAYVEKLIKPITSGTVDMVVGSRFIERQGFQTSFIRRFGIKLIKSVIKICCGASITDTTSGFRAVNKKLIQFFSGEYAQDYPEPEAIVSAVLTGYRVLELPVVMAERSGGVSSINAVRSVYYMLKVLLALTICRIGIQKNDKF